MRNKIMKSCLIFGTGSTGRRIYNSIKDSHKVIGFLDNDKSKWGGNIDGIPIIGNADGISDINYDEVIVGVLPAMDIIKHQLIVAGVPDNKINTEYISTQVNARINFVRDFSLMYKEQIGDSCVAEGGVYQGDFAKEINECFPCSPLYLFDTFEGFDKRDVSVEHSENFSTMQEKHIGNTSIELVLSKMPYRENVIIKRGYFPETASGLADKNFFFVNLDFDLYNPTLEGLRFFYPKLDKYGVILVHDYFNEGYKGVKKAVYDFLQECDMNVKMFPIGDHCSIAIVK